MMILNSDYRYLVIYSYPFPRGDWGVLPAGGAPRGLTLNKLGSIPSYEQV
nr:MAG TPA: hypothetical protein [Caudoviricetes sp.]